MKAGTALLYEEAEGKSTGKAPEKWEILGEFFDFLPENRYGSGAPLLRRA